MKNSTIALLLIFLFLAFVIYAEFKVNRLPDPPKTESEIMMDNFNQSSEELKKTIEKFDSVQKIWKNDPYIKKILENDS